MRFGNNADGYDANAVERLVLRRQAQMAAAGIPFASQGSRIQDDKAEQQDTAPSPQDTPSDSNESIGLLWDAAVNSIKKAKRGGTP